MATWTGWEVQFFNAARILNTPPNQRFLTAWAAHATSPTCGNNPIDLSVSTGGSSNCANGTGIHPHTMRYPTHSQAASAFDIEIHQSWAHAILQALDSGNPFQVKNYSDVGSALVSWGSVHFFDWYMAQMQAGSGGGSGGGGIAPQTHRAWSDLQRSVDKRLPAALHAAEKASLAALRATSRARKVRH